MTDVPVAERGAVVLAPFPRMMGKRRPGIVLFADRMIVATPLTTERRGLGPRLPIAAASGADGGGVARQSFALPAMTAALPLGAVEARLGAAPDAVVEEIERTLAEIFGAGWRRVSPPLSSRAATPRRRKSAARRRGPRSAARQL